MILHSLFNTNSFQPLSVQVSVTMWFIVIVHVINDNNTASKGTILHMESRDLYPMYTCVQLFSRVDTGKKDFRNGI